jgi:hypothetical protein
MDGAASRRTAELAIEHASGSPLEHWPTGRNGRFRHKHALEPGRFEFV